MEPSALTVRNGAGEVSFLRLLALVVRHRWWIFGGAVLFAAVAWMRASAEPVTYTATASFVPQGRRSSSATSGLAAQFGLSLPGGDAAQSPQFYVDLVTSGVLLRPVVDSMYSFRTDTGVVTTRLVDYLAPKRGSALTRRELAVGSLRGMLSAGASTKTGVITLSVRTPYRELSQQIAERVLEGINTFYLQSRVEQAVTERRFTAARLQQVESELRASENRLQIFLQGNRDYSRSPQLSFQHSRLARDVEMRQQVYTALAQAYEQARIEELRDTPVITVLEQPQLPIMSDPRTSARKTVFAAMLGAALAFLLGLLRDVFRRSGDGDPATDDIAVLRAAVRGAAQDIKHPMNAIRRRKRGSQGT